MSKFPYLDMLRADNQQIEDRITAPYKSEIEEAATMIRSLRATLRSIERELGTEIAREMTVRIASELSGKVRDLILTEAAKTGGPFEEVTVTIPAELVRFYRPQSIEAHLLRSFAKEVLPNLSLSIQPINEQSATAIDIRLPPLGYRHVQRQ